MLTRCKAGLLVEDPIVTPDEATWVIRRLAELMNWPPLATNG